MEDDFLIECIENEIESSNFDFKRDIYDFDIEESKEDFLIDVMSFANSHANGSKYIITGVKLNKDNSRKLRGINEQEIKDGADYQSLVNDNIEPNIIIDFKVIDYDGNKFGIFKIGSENNDKPYLLSKQYGKLQKGYTRIRKGQKNEYVSRRDFDIFYKEKNHDEYSSINLKGIINRNISDTFEIKKFENPVDLKKAQTIIENLYKQINDIKVIRSSKSTIKFGNELSIEQENIDTIQQYAKENNIKINFIKIDSLEKAKKAGIPVIAVDALIYNRGFVDGTVVSNNYQAGEQCAKDLMKRRKKGKILFLVQSENKSAIDRIKGFKETLEKAGWKYENVGELECQGQLELSQPLVEKVLNKTKDIDVVMALNDPSAMGAMAALDAEHMLSDVLVYGADGSPEAKTMIYENKMAATSAQSPRTTGKKTVEMLYKILDEKKTEKQCIVPVSLITKDNINDYSLSGWQ